MGMTKTTGAITTEITHAYHVLREQGVTTRNWVRIEDIATKTGLTIEELTEGLEELIGYEGFYCEPDPFRSDRQSVWNRTQAPIIGGERRHLIRWV